MQKPSYYAKLAIEPLEYAYKNKLNPYQFNAIKYITRYKDKNGIEDLQKAIHCLEEFKEILCQNNTNPTVSEVSAEVKFVTDPFEYAYKNKFDIHQVNALLDIIYSNPASAITFLQKLIQIETENQKL